MEFCLGRRPTGRSGTTLSGSVIPSRRRVSRARSSSVPARVVPGHGPALGFGPPTCMNRGPDVAVPGKVQVGASSWRGATSRGSPKMVPQHRDHRLDRRAHCPCCSPTFSASCRPPEPRARAPMERDWPARVMGRSVPWPRGCVRFQVGELLLLSVGVPSLEVVCLQAAGDSIQSSARPRRCHIWPVSDRSWFRRRGRRSWKGSGGFIRPAVNGKSSNRVGKEKGTLPYPRRGNYPGWPSCRQGIQSAFVADRADIFPPGRTRPGSTRRMLNVDCKYHSTHLDVGDVSHPFQ